MAESFAAVKARAAAWIDQGRAAGWLTEDDARQLAEVETRRPADLVRSGTFRPLVVALFGGTGVGKSSLLNRIAGEPIARAGVERPTSREVTVYVHRDVALADLPPELPLDRVRIARHHGDDRHDCIWIDAPDIDSAEEANRRCALAWLPHIHLVCYVVSPERYKDDAGWRVLRQRGDRHGWMFVMNRWDEGHPRQRDDFARLLAEAGFDQPLLACTSCGPAGRMPSTADELSVIQRRVAELLDEHGAEALGRAGEQARLRDLDQVIKTAVGRLGDDAGWTALRAGAAEQWSAAATAIVAGAAGPMRAVAGRIAVRHDAWRERLAQVSMVLRGSRGRTETPADDPDPALLAADLWDDAAGSKLAACLDSVEVSARRASLTCGPVRQRLDAVAVRAATDVGAWTGARLSRAMDAPGTPARRAVRRALAGLARLLPTAGLLWVAYAVITGYYRASIGQGAFLGGDFAVHSTMFVFVLWLLPTLAERCLRPSLEAAAAAAIETALGEALAELGRRLDTALQDARREATTLRARGEVLRSEIDAGVQALDGATSESVRGLLPRRAGMAAVVPVANA